jgi:hypothetical protein
VLLQRPTFHQLYDSVVEALLNVGTTSKVLGPIVVCLFLYVLKCETRLLSMVSEINDDDNETNCINDNVVLIYERYCDIIDDGVCQQGHASVERCILC